MEKVELGERIEAFTLESLDGSETKMLLSGTSVGYLRALTFEAGAYKRLKLTLKGAVAPITLRTLSLNIYDEDMSEEAMSLKRTNLAALPGAEVIFSEDNKAAQVMFGGIFPFDTVVFNVHWIGGDYKIYAFDGSKFYVIAEGRANGYQVRVDLPARVEGSYQIKIEYSKTFSQEPDIIVS